ncbi:alkaline ceramidase-like protein [Tothia fuscella]|uniref:Alkaline ceramidase-like protein n=1 Tax=Tothia fuscella TaxID=1048955 RepID=A0A9P4TZ50_9PEZI|nr:alkaline ceramidase-like protein [Tothia fuscella]
MLSWLPAIPYPPAGDGYWSPDYYATPYAAEIVNTLTNLLFFWLGIKGVRNCLREGHEKIFLISFLGYLVVGSGSFLFHATLKYPMQLIDELSMIYTTCIMFYATFSYRKSVLYVTVLGTLLVALATFITGYYHYLQDPTFHQNMYGLLTAVVLLRAMYIMEVNIRPSLREKERQAKLTSSSVSPTEKSEMRREDERDIQILKTMWSMIAYGLSIFLGGFFVWNLDNIFCGTLIRWRREIGLPWGILLEGHGWWHIMTGIGAYFYLTWGIWLRHCLNGKQDDYELIWPRVATSIPVVVRKRKGIAQNGHTKKKA